MKSTFVVDLERVSRTANISIVLLCLGQPKEVRALVQQMKRQDTAPLMELRRQELPLVGGTS